MTRPAPSIVWFVLLGLVALAGGCDPQVTRIAGDECQIDLRVYTPPLQDAFAQVATLRIELRYPEGTPVERQVDQSASEFVLGGPPGEGVVLRIEGLDIDNRLISSGQSMPFDLQPDQVAEVDLLFARSGEFTRLLGRLDVARFGHTASLTGDGRVLIFGGAAGGDPDAPGDLAPPELYDPRTQQSCGQGGFECPAAPGLDRRLGHSATATDDGDVLLFGGRDEQGQLVDAVLVYEADSGAFRRLGGVNPERVPPRAGHTAVTFQLEIGEGTFRETVLIAGGEQDVDGQPRLATGGMLYDPYLESFSQTDLPMQHPRRLHSATVFGPDHDRVLLVGGQGDAGLVGPAELFDGRTFVPLSPQGAGASDSLATPRVHHAAIETAEGILIAGGDDGLVSLDAPELFVWEADRGSGLFPLEVSAAHAGHRPRSGALAAALPAGGMLLAGGELADGFERSLLQTAELLLPEAGADRAAYVEAPPLGLPLAFASVARLAGGGLLFTGGLTRGPDGPVPSDEVWYYNPR